MYSLHVQPQISRANLNLDCSVSEKSDKQQLFVNYARVQSTRGRVHD